MKSVGLKSLSQEFLGRVKKYLRTPGLKHSDEGVEANQ